MPEVQRPRVEQVGRDDAVTAEVAVLFERYREHYGRPPDERGSRAWLEGLLVSGNVHLFVARGGAVALGMAMAVSTPASLRLGHFWQLRDLYVAAEHRGRGVGAALVAHVCDAAGAAGASRVSLTTEADNVSALSLYSAMGFEQVRGYVAMTMDLPVGRRVGEDGRMAIHIAQDAAADQVLSEDPFALLLGMLLDQQYPMEHAFRGPAKLLDRFGTLEPAAVAAADPEEFATLCAQPPAVHRYPGSMATRIQALAQVVADRYAGNAASLWEDAADGRELLRRLQELPGFGAQKSKIFVALLAKQLGVRPEGWEAVAGDYATDGFRSVADVTGAESLQKVREFKKSQKAARRSAPQEPPRP